MDVTKPDQRGALEKQAVRGLSLDLKEGEFTPICGSSRFGKTLGEVVAGLGQLGHALPRDNRLCFAAARAARRISCKASLLWLLALTATCSGCATRGPGSDREPPNPVILVAGTFSPEGANAVLANRLRKDGYQVSVFELVDLGRADIDLSARALAGRIDETLARTGAARVDVIGHSQGALVARQQIRFHGGIDEVEHYIGLGGPQYGTSVANLVALLGSCRFRACQQMQTGSTFLAALNSEDDTPGPVIYTTIYTLLDQLVRPAENATLRGGANNVNIQEHCPLRAVDHVGLILDGAVYSVIASMLAAGVVEADCWAP